MAAPMKYRLVKRALTAQRCTLISTRGSHEKWECPCGSHTAIVVAHKGEVSPGVVSDTVNKLQCLPKGWLR